MAQAVIVKQHGRLTLTSSCTNKPSPAVIREAASFLLDKVERMYAEENKKAG